MYIACLFALFMGQLCQRSRGAEHFKCTYVVHVVSTFAAMRPALYWKRNV